jgi:succinyl-CoA synthetase beta subunit
VVRIVYKWAKSVADPSGGASVVYSDAIAAAGFAHELANYGEYSGAPTEGQTYEYAKTISESSRFGPCFNVADRS